MINTVTGPKFFQEHFNAEGVDAEAKVFEDACAFFDRAKRECPHSRYKIYINVLVMEGG